MRLVGDDVTENVDLDALEQAVVKMTPGRWCVRALRVNTAIAVEGGSYVADPWTGVRDAADAPGIVMLHNAAPALIAELRRLRETVKGMESACVQSARMARSLEKRIERREAR